MNPVAKDLRLQAPSPAMETTHQTLSLPAITRWFKGLFLNLGYCLALLLLLVVPAQAFQPHGDGRLRLYNYHLDEFLEVTFRHQGQVDPQAIASIHHLLRSRDNAEQNAIDLRLLDLLDHLQDHFQIDTVEIISGYRRKEFNQRLLEAGRQVSPRSLHTQGHAVDFHIDEIREETLRDYLISLQHGGVGYYGPLDFIHIDVGPVRTWGESEDFARKLIGILVADAPVRLTSNQNDYAPQESLHFTWEYQSGFGPEQVKDIRLEHFWRGKWLPCSTQAPDNLSSTLPISDLRCSAQEAQPFGKYRWTFRIHNQNAVYSSNEFYLKKQ